MVKRNPNFGKLVSGYLFPEINRRKNELLSRIPDAKLISLGIGNTTEPLTNHIADGLHKGVSNLQHQETYTGYGDEQGLTELRQRIAKTVYSDLVDQSEVFVSDGAKCDCARLQQMFGQNVKIAVQDPAYPVYIDGSVIAGATGHFNNQSQGFDNVVYMSCLPENNFFYELKEPVDLIYFCSPNNPTGAVATSEQLKQLVKFAKQNNAIIIFDAAYAMYIKDQSLPKSIYEIDGADEVAIEVNSLSKPAGFTGIRLGWTVVPKKLKYECGNSINTDFNRMMCTVFNGASNIAQQGALFALSPQGLDQMKETIDFYMYNASIIKSTLEKSAVESWGGDNSPFIWARFPKYKSWDLFNEILERAHVICTPGSGFGNGGEGFIRLSAFGHRNDIIEAAKRLEAILPSLV